MGFWDLTASSLAEPVAGAIIGQLTAGQQYNRQKRLMDLQMANQKELNIHGQEMAMDLWNKTNYEAQVKHLKAAGLNPAMLYGKGGGGGTTSNSSGGSASGGTASQAPLMDLHTLNFAKTEAEINLINAQADALRGNTPVSSATEKSIKTDTELKQLEIKAKTETMDVFIKSAQASLDKLITDTNAQLANIANTQKDTEIKDEEIKNLKKDLEVKENQIALMVVQKTLDKAKIKLTEEQTKAIPVELQQTWAKIKNEVRSLNQKDTELGQAAEKLKQGWDQLNQNQQQLLINKFEALLKKDMPNITNVLGGSVKDLISGYLNLTGRELNSPKLGK